MNAIQKAHGFHPVFDAQAMFRLLLKAMANPASPVEIRPFAAKFSGEYPEMLAIAMTLLDNEVGFSTCENQTLSDDIASLTLSRREALEAADYLFITDPSLLGRAMVQAKCGALANPHRSATIVVRNQGAALHPVRLAGPGIRGAAPWLVTDIVWQALEFRDGLFYEYPQGVDLLFVTEGGELVAIPRLTRKEA